MVRYIKQAHARVSAWLRTLPLLLIIPALLISCGGDAESDRLLGLLETKLTDVPMQAGAWRKATGTENLDSVDVYADTCVSRGGKLSPDLLLKLGNVMLSRNQFAEAHRYFTQALNDANHAGETQKAAFANGNMGLACIGMDSVEAAIGYLERAASQEEELGNLEAQAIELRHLAMLVQLTGEGDDALKYMYVCRDIYRQIDNPELLAEYTWSIGFSHLVLDRPDSALVYLKEAQQLIKDNSLEDTPPFLDQVVDSLSRLP
ncbi:MAG: hypothetical protein KKA42_12215 [candidate division Zixibacteria bacterium]|nr:hypothetical protein [candidate division Zixibacteria bacterium]